MIEGDLEEVIVALGKKAKEASKLRVWRTHLRALTGRVLVPGGLTAATRHAGAESWVTGRPMPYHECTLRRSVGVMVRWDGDRIVETRVEHQVQQAVEATGERAVMFTDMFDQVVYTKKPAHAGPIGNLGNRILGCVYIGLTFVKLGVDGPSLGYHVSWHKPASPLIDALQELYAPGPRADWVRAWVWMVVWDRGGQGILVLQWAIDRGIPYLTISNGSAYLSSQGNPSLETPEGLPVFVRRDVRLQRPTADPDGTRHPAPQTVIFPAHRDKGEDCKKGLPYRTTADLEDEELARLDDIYKERWGGCENRIKDSIGLGFGVNREREIEQTTSRGQDGQMAKLLAREDALDRKIEQTCQKPPCAKVFRTIEQTIRKRDVVRRKQDELARQPLTKGARPRSAREMFIKYLHLLVGNALLLLLAKSTVEEVQHMTLIMVRELLLARPALAVVDADAVTLWIEPIADARQRAQQAELIRLFNEHVPTRIRDRPAILRLAKSTGGPGG